MSQTTTYRPLTVYFAWSVIALGLWLAGSSALRYYGIVVPSSESLPPEDQVLRFMLRLLASDFQCGMAILFIGTLFYAAVQFAAIKLDERQAQLAFAAPREPARWWAPLLAAGAGRAPAFWRQLDSYLSQPSAPAAVTRAVSLLNEHIRFGGAAAVVPLRFALWLFPMLGFLGTVVGLSFAVNDLAVMVTGDTGGGLRDPKFKDVLSNLHLAFDTTIQGIIFAIVIIVLLAALDLRWQRLSHRTELLAKPPQESPDAVAAPAE